MIKKILLIVVCVLVATGIIGFFALRRAYRSGALQEAVVDKVTEQFVERTASSTPVAAAEQANFIKKMLGFDTPQTYLVLLLNNTELRPGGGFIGSYAVVRVDKGVPHIDKVEGTELLDYSGYPENFPSVPPDAIKTYLGVPRWYFRDANWSPDFASSAVKALDLYHKERGFAADNISGVIGITATTLEELLKLTGPVTVNGVTFTADNVIERLEYEVEVAFEKKGLERSERKQMLADLVRQVAQKLATDVFSHWQEYFTLGQRLLREKNVIVYSQNAADQSVLDAKQWTGSIAAYQGGDYLLWTDANLGALKTDAVIERSLTYSIAPSGTKFIGTATMRYAHTGSRDWKTSRYLSYVRLYLPLGTKFISMKGIDKNARGLVTTTPDRGTEFGRTWFGGFASVNPGTVEEVSFTFEVAPAVMNTIQSGVYYGLFQKQLGAVKHALTLNLDFGRKVVSATPSEPSSESDDNRYRLSSDLREDRYVEARLVQ